MWDLAKVHQADFLPFSDCLSNGFKNRPVTLSLQFATSFGVYKKQLN